MLLFDSAGHLYVSAAGFTPEFQQLARTDPKLRLLSLDDLYEFSID